MKINKRLIHFVLKKYLRYEEEELKTWMCSIQMVGGGADESSAEEVYEEKMKDALDLASEKAAATRTKGLEALCSGLLKRYFWNDQVL